MGLTVKASGGSSTFKPVPSGMHLARCYRIVDMGTQTTTWKGQTKQQPKVMLQFEVHSEDADGNPIVTDNPTANINSSMPYAMPSNKIVSMG